MFASLFSLPSSLLFFCVFFLGGGTQSGIFCAVLFLFCGPFPSLVHRESLGLGGCVEARFPCCTLVVPFSRHAVRLPRRPVSRGRLEALRWQV